MGGFAALRGAALSPAALKHGWGSIHLSNTIQYGGADGRRTSTSASILLVARDDREGFDTTRLMKKR